MARMLAVEEEPIKNSGSTTNSTSPAPQRTTMAIPNVSGSSGSIRLFSLGLFFIFYLAFGASIFSAIESPQEIHEFLKLCLQLPTLREFWRLRYHA